MSNGLDPNIAPVPDWWGAGAGADTGAASRPLEVVSIGGWDFPHGWDPDTGEEYWGEKLGRTATGGGGGGGADSALGWGQLGLNQEQFGWQKQTDIWGQAFSEEQFHNLSAAQQAAIDQANREFGNLSAWQQAQVAAGQASQIWEEYRYANPSAYESRILELQHLSLESENHWKEISANIAVGQLDLARQGMAIDDKNTNRSLDIQLELGRGQLDLGKYEANMRLQIANVQAASAAAVAAADNAARIAVARIGAASAEKVAKIAAEVQREAIALQAELGRRELKLKEEIFMLEFRRSPADYMAYWGSTQPGATQGAPAATQGQAAPQTAAGAGAMWGMAPPTTYGGQGTPAPAPTWLTQTLAGQPMGEQQMPAWGFERGPAPY